MEIRPEGSPTARIMVVQDCPGYEELRNSAPLQGHAGKEFNRMLSEAGIMKSETFTTSVIRTQVPFNSIDRQIAQKKADITLAHSPLHNRMVLQPFLDGLGILQREIDLVKPRVILALGNGALFALTGKWGIKSWRGSELEYTSPGGHSCVVIPAYPPSYILQVWKDRQITVSDLRRSKALSLLEFRKPKAYNFLVRPSFTQVVGVLKDLLQRVKAGPTVLSVDIETRAGHIACTGIAWSKLDAICIPQMVANAANGCGNYWLEEEESYITYLLYRLLTHPNAHVVGQNFLYDAQYFYRHFHFVPNLKRDTMIGHHAMWSNLPKGLDYLSSMYCEEHVYWKDESKNWDPKLGEDQLWVYNCLAGDTRILMADHTWKQLSSVQEDDVVLAFDEEPTGQSYSRKLKPSLVTKTASALKQLYRVELANGQVLRATADHKFLICNHKRKDSKATHTWKELKDIKPGDYVRFLEKPWVQDASFEAGWFSGILDGEGTLGISKVSGGFFPRLGFSQKPGQVLDRACRILADHGFSYRVSPKESATYIDINGGLSENLRLLGVFQPIRLSLNMIKGGITHGWSGFSAIERVEILSITEDTVETVFDISTTQGTFIAEGVVVHNCKDCVITFEVDEAEQAAIEKLSPTWPELRSVHDFQQELFWPVLQTMIDGLLTDTDRKGELAEKFQTLIAEREAYITAVVGRPLNIRSPKQMTDFFYRELAQPIVKSRKTGNPTCDDSALERIGQREPLLLPLLKAIAELRSYGVMLSTFVEAPLDSDGRMRCSFNITGTETYRFSSSENAFGSGMNLQNVPPELRALFIPDPEHLFFDIDLDSADLRIVVWESGCKEMKQMFAEGLKPYVEVAKEYYRDPTIDKHHPSYKLFKALCHGTNYLGTPSGLSGRIGLVTHEVERIQKWYYSKFPEIKNWQDDIVNKVNTQRRVENAFGYRMNFFDRLEGTIYNQAVAWIPQSTVACLINRGYMNIHKTLPEVKVLLQVHDSLAGIFPSGEGQWIDKIKEACAVPIPYPEPLIIPVGIKSSDRSWGDCG